MSGGSFNYLCWKEFGAYDDHSLNDFVSLVVYCMKHENYRVNIAGGVILEAFNDAIIAEAKKKEPIIDMWSKFSGLLKAIEWEKDGDCGDDRIVEELDKITNGK